MARALTYTHGSLSDQTGLKKLAHDLLRALSLERDTTPSRPLFFICHSIGGLVVKLALTEASRNPKYQPILEHCYGVTFFGKDELHSTIYQYVRLTSHSNSSSRFQLSFHETIRSQHPEASAT